MIFVTVGSQKFPFDRLIRKVDQLVEDHTITEEVYIQTGSSDYIPCHCRHQAFYDRDKFARMVQKCRILIKHGGVGIVVNEVKQGNKVIVVPRRSSYGEHVDEHQLQLLEQFHARNLIYACMDVDDLPYVMKRIDARQFNTYQSNAEAFVASVDEFLCSQIKKKG